MGEEAAGVGLEAVEATVQTGYLPRATPGAIMWTQLFADTPWADAHVNVGFSF